MGALSELGHVLTDVDTTDAGVAVNGHVVSEGDDDLLDLLGKLAGGGEDDSLGGLDRGVDLEEGGRRVSGVVRRARENVSSCTEANPWRARDRRCEDITARGREMATQIVQFSPQTRLLLPRMTGGRGRRRAPRGRAAEAASAEAASRHPPPPSSPRAAPAGRQTARTHPLEDGDREGGGLAGSRLGLGNNVVALDDGDDGALLDSRGALETVGVDTAEEVGLELHVVEARGGMVGLDENRALAQIEGRG